MDEIGTLVQLFLLLLPLGEFIWEIEPGDQLIYLGHKIAHLGHPKKMVYIFHPVSQPIPLFNVILQE